MPLGSTTIPPMDRRDVYELRRSNPMSESNGTAGVKVTYLDTQDGGYGTVIAYLDGKNLLVSELYPAAEAVKSKLDFATSVTPQVTASGAQLKIQVPEIRYGTYLDDARLARLAKVLRPAYTRKVGASARVVRTETGRHTQTLVTIARESGESLKEIAVRKINNVDGVLRARVTSSTIILSMATPVANDDEGAITSLIEAVTEKIDAMLTRPISVHDDDPDAALDPANDYPSTAADQAASTPAAG